MVLGHEGEFPTHRGAAHQAVVGVEGDGEPGSVEHADGVFRGCPALRVQIRGGTDLEGQTPVSDQFGQPPGSHDLAVLHLAVLHDFDAVTYPLGAADIHRRSQARQSTRLSGVDGQPQSGSTHMAKGGEVAVGGESGLGPGEVEPDDALVGIPYGEAGDVEGVVVLTHGIEDDPPHQAGGGGPRPHSVEAGLDDGVGAEPTAGEEVGREAEFGIDDTVGGQVLDSFTSDTGDRLCCLHDTHRVREGVEIAFQGARATLIEPVGQRHGVIGGKFVTDGIGQFEHRLGPETTVEMVVEDDGR